MAFILKKQANLKFKKNTTFKIPKTGIQAFLPSSLAGLSLWLKADAGVSKFSYNYASPIVISGTSDPSFAGTYTADGVPSYDYDEGQINGYTLNGPTGKTISWDSNNQSYLLSSNNEAGSFSSGDGENWTPNTAVIQIVITGFTGIYSGANGTYNGNGTYFTRVGGGYTISGSELYDNEFEEVIATAPENYSGLWTPTNYISSVTLTGAGTTEVDGTYTRTDTQFEMYGVQFTASGGRTLNYDGGDNNFLTTNREYAADPSDLTYWFVETGDPEAPSGSTGTSARSVGSPTSTTTTRPTGSVSGVVTTSTANTDNVIGWADQSGNDRNVSADVATIPSYEVISGKQFISFEGVDRLIGSNGIWPDGNDVDYGTIIAVVRFPSSSSANGASSIFIHESALYFRRGKPYGDGLYGTIDDANIVEGSSNLGNNTNYLVEMIFDIGGGFCKIYLNGSENGSIETNGANGGANFFIGQGEDPFSMAEIIVYKRVLTTPERQQVETYLNQKYNIY